MDLIRKIKVDIYRIKKYFKNKKFRQEVKKEKEKKYLFKSAKKEEKLALFDVYKKQKEFSIYINQINSNVKKFKVIYIITGVTLIVLSLYIAIISPYFRISPSNMIIERLDTLTDINIAYKSIEDIYGTSIFLIDKEKIKNSLTNYQKNIKNISISRLYPNGLKIILDSYKPQFFTQFAGNEKKYIVTTNGVLIYEKNIDKILHNLEIVDINLIEGGFFDYKEGVKEDTMKKIIYTRDLFKEVFIGKNIAKLLYFKLENELHIYLESGTKIILELNTEINKQLATLKYYNDNNKDIISGGEIFYIDTRIIGKVFICKDKNICQKNLIRIYPNYYKK